MYPVMLDVRGVRCLVVGGGAVALRKVRGLLDEGAALSVVASEPIAALEELAGRGAIQLEKRPYREGEAAEYKLVFAATDDREVNRRVFADGQSAGRWVNVADDPELCSFHLPARVKRGAMQIAIASAGEAPFAARRLRQVLERRLGPQWGAWGEAAARFREAVYRAGLSAEEQEARFDAFFAGTFDAERLLPRVPSEAEFARYLDPGSRPPGPGLVSLVGAGPGDPGLLSLRGRQRLMQADAVVFDRLAETALPCDLPEHVELYNVGKRPDHHPVPQEEINALLVRLALEGKRVVRLKGGDPFVFGRGGEEAEELVRAGVSFEIVPCATAGVAVPAYAGIPVTHRREAVRVTLLTAHETFKQEGPQVRWDLLAADPHATLLGYMGVSRLDFVAEKLIAAGMDPATPAALIERGTTSAQRVVRCTLSELPGAAQSAGIRPPALFVIGPTVRHAEVLDWRGPRPLLGERLVMVGGADALGDELEANGAEVVAVPLRIGPAARVVMEALPLTGAIVRAVEEVEALDAERSSSSWSVELPAWCLGEQVAARARELGWANAIELAAATSGAELAERIAAGRNRA